MLLVALLGLVGDTVGFLGLGFALLAEDGDEPADKFGLSGVGGCDHGLGAGDPVLELAGGLVSGGVIAWQGFGQGDRELALRR